MLKGKIDHVYWYPAFICVNNIYALINGISTGVNAGCVEAATMAGMETSRAVCGFPEVINGEHGFEPYKK